MGQATPIQNKLVVQKASLRDYVLHQAQALGDDEVLDLADLLHDLLRTRRAERRATQSYAILRTGDEWQIVCSRRRMGHFQTRDLALQAGARLAAEAQRSGREVELLVQSFTGELKRLDVKGVEATPTT